MGAVITGILWLVLVFVLASEAKKKGQSYGNFFVIGLFLSPLIGFIILAVKGNNKQVLEKQSIELGITKKCPFCANEIKREAIVCQYCGKDLPETEMPKGNKVIKSTNLNTHLPGNMNNRIVCKLVVDQIVQIKEVEGDRSYIITNNGLEGWCESKALSAE